MFLKAINNHRLILAIVVLVTLIAGMMLIICPPALFPDPGSGFQVMRCMQMGGGFNLNITPSQANIAKNTVSFLTWWSPGQYLLPYFFNSILGINAGQAAAVTVLFCDILGIFGFYCFFKKVGFTARLAALSIAFIACQQFYAIPYVFYNGGETLLFGFLGWFLYGCFSFKTINWKLFVFIILSGWIGFFCKSAFLWMYAAGLFCLWINLSQYQKEIISRIKKGVVLAIPAAISFVAIYKFYMSKGNNPASASPGFRLSLEALGFPFASPLLSGFSIDELTHGLIYHQDTPIFSPNVSILVLVLLAILSIALFTAIILYIPQTPYKLAVSAFYGISVLFFLSVFLRQLNISYEARHLRIVGLLFVPGTLYLVMQLKPLLKYLFMVLWLGIAFTTVKYAVNGYQFNTHISAHGPSGFSQQFIDQQALDYLQQLDKTQPADAIFAFTSNDLGLDIMHHRIISMDPFEDVNAGDYVNNNEYQGKTGPLFVLLPAGFEKNMAMFKRCFPGYHHFSVKRISKGYILLSGL